MSLYIFSCWLLSLLFLNAHSFDDSMDVLNTAEHNTSSIIHNEPVEYSITNTVLRSIGNSNVRSLSLLDTSLILSSSMQCLHRDFKFALDGFGKSIIHKKHQIVMIYALMILSFVVLLFYFRHSLFPILILFYGTKSIMEILAILMKFERNDIAPLITYRKYIFFGSKVHVIGDINFAKHIFKSTAVRKSKYIRRKWVNCVKFENAVLGSGSGKEWRKQRLSFHPYFISQNKGFDRNSGYSSQCKEIVLQHLNSLSLKKNGTLLCKELISLILKIHFECMLHIDMKRIDDWDLFAETIVQILEHISTGNTGYGPKEFETFIKSKYLELIHDSMAKNELLGTNKGNLSPLEIESMVSNIIFALTPAFGLFWMLFILYQPKNKAHLAKCKNDEVYLKMCLMEALRMYSPVPILLNRVCIENDIYQNIQINKGDEVVLSPQFIQNLDFNHENADCFKPNRWLNKCNKMFCNDFLSFGFGPQQCLGRKIAINEMMIFLKQFIAGYHMQIIDDKLSNLNHGKQIKNIIYSFPRNDCKVNITKQNQ